MDTPAFRPGRKRSSCGAGQGEAGSPPGKAQCDDLQEDPLLIALGNARAAREAADREIRRLLAYGREFRGDRPYQLEPLAQASGLTPSGIRTAYGSSEIDTVARCIGRTPDSRRTRPPATPEAS
ncbi:hypothetical protein [Streptomyces sp. Root369]|uniref:hypothetical protein n=1 Tax=Streptomyces sp. Root369 TaxID=1736523 RepID=UPI000A5CFCC7|nr:hypothetical protein [Streptomyces sp. Root369]